MNPFIYIKYGTIAIGISFIGYYVVDYQNTKAQNLALADSLKYQTEQVEVSNANLEYIGNEYGILQKEQENELRSIEKRLRDQAAEDAQTASINFADPYASSVINSKLCNAFAKADSGIRCADNQDLPSTYAPNTSKGEWFCFDRENTNALVGNVQRMGEYVFTSEGYK